MNCKVLLTSAIFPSMQTDMQTEEERWGNILQGARMRKYNWAVPIRYPASSPPVCQSSGKFFCF
jgi:hypothetical protein